MANKLTATEIKEQLRYFTGSEQFYRHGLNRSVIYTEGVQFLAEAASAYWLVDAIASYFGTSVMRNAMRADSRLQDIQFWTLTVKDSQAELVMRADAGEVPAIKQEIEFTDFPLDQIDIWASPNGQGWTLYLPSEH